MNFDPTLGSEIKKTRPAVVVSSDAIGKLPIKLVTPLTDWKPYFKGNAWHIKLMPNADNGLRKASAIDTLQLRSVDVRRFVRRLGTVTDGVMLEITLSIIAVVEADLTGLET